MEAGKGVYILVLTLLMTGLILAIGVLIIDKFGTATMTSSLTSYEEVTTSSKLGTLSKQRVQAITYVGNQTNSSDANNNGIAFQIGSTTNLTNPDSRSSGIVRIGASMTDGKYNFSYTYLANSTTSGVVGYVADAITPISTTWMSLIVTVAILAIILGLVISSFGQRR